MSKVPLDFNTPIMHNRDEAIAIRFYGCIKNACEVMLVSMLENDFGYWVKRYPGVMGISSLKTVKEAYYFLLHFTPKDFLTQMRKPYEPLTERDITGDISRLLGDLADPNKCSVTSLEIAIHQIAKYDFCKKVIVYDTAMSDKTKMYISDLFADTGNKVYMYTGFLKEIVKEEKEVNTFFVDDVEDLMAIMEEYEFEKREKELSEKQFFVESPNAVISQPSKDEKQFAEFKYQQYMKDAVARFDANVMWITSHYVDLNDPNPTAEVTTLSDLGIKRQS